MQTASASKLKRLGIALVLIVAWSLFVAFSGIKQRTAEPPRLEAPLPPASAEFSWTLRDLDDRPVEFSRYKGKPILLNVFATWCPPCREEMPSISALAADPRIKAKGLAVICVSAGESAELVRAFAKEKAYGMTILRATTLPPVFQTTGIPATFLIASDGQIKSSEVGGAKWDDPSVVEFLEKLK